MRPSLLLVLPILASAACGTGSTSPQERAAVEPAAPVVQPAEAAQTPPPAEGMVNLHTLAGTGLKFNGVYDNVRGDIHYYMRFFERGNVVLIAGWQKPGDPVDLRSFLRQDAQSGENNLHNTPVEQRNDSLFFTTMAPRGAITYAGVVDGDTLRFLKHSMVTRKRSVVNYHFIPD